MATICVYGSGRDNIDPAFIKETEKLGRLIGNKGYKLVFGGGSSGLMGAVARGITEVNGYIIGVTPHFMHKYEPIFKCSETIETDTISERKNIMEEHADAFIIAPGGIGTFDEFFQILTLKELDQLGNKPIVLLNINGYYDMLRDLLLSLKEKGFLREGALNQFTICQTAEEALATVESQLKLK